MPLATATKDALLDTLAIDTLSLHSAYSVIGANEIAGGIPPYLRLLVTFAPSAGGVRFLMGVPYLFDVPASTVAWIGMWDVLGNFIGMAPNGGTALRLFVADDLVLNVVTCLNHGFIDGDSVVLWPGALSPLPFGLFEGTTYYVMGSTPDTFQLALGVGIGVLPIQFGTTGAGFIQKIVAVTFIAQDTFTVTALALDATVVT